MKIATQRRGDILVPHIETKANGGWKTPAPFIKAEARETDKALLEILEKIGV